ncbi:nuclear transport factor 2 family protein [uncultured Jatrophihabitans sp.]|uniref:nuclear transport factor 2 family protein n=1 Tax=uncultured Jatrophihabitans sp. TaxID=1610747 RepID=UPI0035CC7F5B
MTRIAVAGATGHVGAAVVDVLRTSGHDAVEIARSAGVDVITGDGLDDALTGVSTVIDVLNTAETDADAATAFFTGTTGTLLAAEERAGVRHHVLLSIVNVDAVPDNGHYLGKVAQEERVRSGTVPWTILRATQFHSFAAMVAGWTTANGVATVAPLLVQPVAVADVAQELVRLALGDPQRRAAELAGPDTHDLVDLARRTLAARGESTAVRASWQDNPFGTSMAGEVLLPGSDAQTGPTTFEDWLSAEPGPRTLAETYYQAWTAHDFDRLRDVLADDATFRGPLGTADSGDDCLAGLRGMSQMMTGLDIVRMVVDGPDVITWYDLLTADAPPTATVNWMHVEHGGIAEIRVAFDPRPILDASQSKG